MDHYNVKNTRSVFYNKNILDILKYINNRFNNKEDPYFNLFKLKESTNIFNNLIHN
jgi:hypothetical protein